MIDQDPNSSNNGLKTSLAHVTCRSVLLESEIKMVEKKKAEETPPKQEISNRSRILLCAFDEMYEHGFQGMRIENILKETKLGKGAIYHHFSSKQALGYAVVDEILVVTSKNQLSGLNTSDDPMALFCELLLNHANNCTKTDIVKGCPLNNLAQEMAGIDSGFQERLSLIFDQRHDFLTLALKRGKALGQIREDVQEWTVAAYILRSIQGCVGTAKCMQSPEMFTDLINVLCGYIEGLRIR